MTQTQTQTQTQHTPGPWRRDDVRGFSRAGPRPGRRGACSIYGPADSLFGRDSLATSHFPPLYDRDGGGFSAEAFAVLEANARLIAAAPDLLAALSAIDKACTARLDDRVDTFAACGHRIQLCGDALDTSQVRDMARAAIAKTRGE